MKKKNPSSDVSSSPELTNISLASKKTSESFDIDEREEEIEVALLCEFLRLSTFDFPWKVGSLCFSFNSFHNKK